MTDFSNNYSGRSFEESAGTFHDQKRASRGKAGEKASVTFPDRKRASRGKAGEKASATFPDRKRASRGKAGEIASVTFADRKKVSKEKTGGKTAAAHTQALEKTRKETESPREGALRILMACFEDGRFSHLALKDEFSLHPEFSEQDRAFITRLVWACCELKIQIDYILNGVSSTKVNKMKPPVRNILRMGVCQILYFDRVPDSAAVNESVKLLSHRKIFGLTGFVNAVLRRVSREKVEIFTKLSSAETPEYIRLSLPEWLYSFLKLEYGEEEAIRMGQYFLKDEHNVYARFRDGRTEKVSGNAAQSEEFRKGEFTIQDYASQQVGKLADPEKGSRVLDVCAAPGGKSCHIAELLDGTGMVYARDLSEEKVRLIRENVRRLHLKNVTASVYDARKQDPSLLGPKGEGTMDLVICDVPCSGIGVIGRKPDIRFSVSIQKIRDLQSLQREIVRASVPYLKEGGKLVYSTCTLTNEENEINRDWIEKELGLTLLTEEKFLPGRPSDGFYIAEFRKENNS